MFKKYLGSSDLAFSVTVNGMPRRIVFEGQLRGTSIYTSRDEAEQKAIEEHHWYGDKFRLVETVDEKKLAAEQKKLAAEQKKKKEKEREVRSFSDIVEAKEYIADKYGISRTKMKTKADILAIAAQKDIEIEIGD